MANHTLFISSLFMLVFQAWHLGSNAFLNILVINGCLSSILNHGTTSAFSKAYDRITMTASALVELYICYVLNLKFTTCLVLIAILLFVFSKLYRSPAFHVLAHIYITFGNISLLHAYRVHNITSAIP